jgi:hypothetical protein
MATDEKTAELPTVGGWYFDATAKPIWEIFDEIAEDLPQEEIEKLPPDAAEQLDHYLYGAPKTTR